ncbi:uncharacterized protein LOC121997767 [Zingiber officinale]|uniref:F-box domain-containing protein n=1 Tax=Zingiber officinale TaxID=94328 RepID=A0A8J5GDD9_ZINOF|nr:uncharacterized protein LOC121997767 [Zingiber officinale]KAG6501229.1 hypothetical protein ZIOFF_041107 [Zingiber officinale]
MADPPMPACPNNSRTLLDLDADALAHCFGFLDIRDISNLSMTCKPLARVAYSDCVWNRLFREKWSHCSVSSGAIGVREQYLARHTALQQLKFCDPWEIHFNNFYFEPASHLFLERNSILLSQGFRILRIRVDFAGIHLEEAFMAHGARITCMRLFPIVETSLFRNGMHPMDNFIVTSSSDHTIRLRWKGGPLRCFKGHNGPVLSLADTLLGDSGSKFLASGGEDCTVRLWSLNTSGKQHPLVSTYRGHEKPLSFLTVAGHKSSLLVSISKDSRVRVWDTSASSSNLSSCVGMTSVTGQPIAMQCHDTLCYIAGGAFVTAIDLRTMQRAFTAAVHAPKMYSFQMLPSKWLMCTGGKDKALLWDIRKSQEHQEGPEPVAELEVNHNTVKFLHMDPYKIVTGGPFDYRAQVWETGTGFLANTLDCRSDPREVAGLSAMAVDQCRIVTSGCSDSPESVCYRDFSGCSLPVSLEDLGAAGSKFWESAPLND